MSQNGFAMNNCVSGKAVIQAAALMTSWVLQVATSNLAASATPFSRLLVRIIVAFREDDATAAAATLLLRARPGLALEPASVLLARADTLALLHWHVLAGLGGGELNRWLNPEDVTTTTAGVAYSRSQSRVSDSHSRRGGMPQPPPHAVLTPSDANRLAAAMSVPLHVMLRLLWLRRKRGSCEYATSVLRLRCRHNDAKAALASAASWPRDAR